MNPITHEQARNYIKLAADGSLQAEQQTALSSHLEACEACRAHAQGLKSVETTLQRVFHTRWDAATPSLDIGKITGKRRANISVNLQRLYPLASASILVIALFVWMGVMVSSRRSLSTSSASRFTATAATVPTPSTQLVTLRATNTDCAQVVYQVRAGDTLESIAKKFKTSKQAIMETNQLNTERLTDAQTLTIPACESAPSQTPTALMAFTVTPSQMTVSSTP